MMECLLFSSNFYCKIAEINITFSFWVVPCITDTFLGLNFQNSRGPCYVVTNLHLEVKPCSFCVVVQYLLQFICLDSQHSLC
jgi:hypothetical protein